MQFFRIRNDVFCSWNFILVIILVVIYCVCNYVYNSSFVLIEGLCIFCVFRDPIPWPVFFSLFSFIFGFFSRHQITLLFHCRSPEISFFYRNFFFQDFYFYASSVDYVLFLLFEVFQPILTINTCNLLRVHVRSSL